MKPTKTYDQERVNFNLAKYKKAGVEYQIVVDPDKAVAFKEGEDIDVDEVVMSEEIFFDAKKGERAGEERMQEIFNTEDPLSIAKIILTEGEIQLTAEHRAKVRDAKRKTIIALIVKNACDPKTKLPHPATRIENAMEEAKVKIDEFKSSRDQVNDIIKQLRPVLPISIEHREISIHIPATHAAKVYGNLQSYGNIKEDSWENDGSWKGIVEVPAGMVNDLFDKLNAATQGGVHTEILK